MLVPVPGPRRAAARQAPAFGKVPVITGVYRDFTGILPEFYRNFTGILQDSTCFVTGILPVYRDFTGFYRDCTGILPNRLPEFTGILPESQESQIQLPESYLCFSGTGNRYRDFTGILPGFYQDHVGYRASDRVCFALAQTCGLSEAVPQFIR